MNWIIRLAVPYVIDVLVEALEILSRRTTNTIDDAVVKAIHDAQDEIAGEIKRLL